MNTHNLPPTNPLTTWLIAGGLTLAVGCMAAAVFSGIGYRLGLWHFRTGFSIIRWAFFGGLGAVALLAAGLIIPPRPAGAQIVMAVVGLIVAGATVYIPWSWKQTLDSLPYIHDITTDPDNPPAFVAIAGLREHGDHPVAYDGPEVAAQQRKAYPDLAPLTTSASPTKVFDAAESVISDMGLVLADTDRNEGRIEATQTSLLYGFKDDMVVRIAATANGAKVDVRSKSRVGRSDLGQNAKRIRTFLSKLQAALS